MKRPPDNNGTKAKDSLRDQKQDVVREAIYNAAIDLFVERGFDETTVEQVAHSAGVSRRTLFRYFNSKDDLLSYSMVAYMNVLKATVEACPAGVSPSAVLRETVLEVIRRTSADAARARQVISISARSSSAQQAYRSRSADVEDGLAEAFASRFGDASIHEVRPRLLAAVTLTVMNASIVSWYRGQHHDLEAAAKEILEQIPLLLCEDHSLSKKAGVRQVKQQAMNHPSRKAAK